MGFSPGELFSPGHLGSLSLSLSLFLPSFLSFTERRREGEREGEKHQCVVASCTPPLPLAHPQLGTRPTTQACALTGNRTNNPLVRRLAFNPLSHTSQGQEVLLKCLPDSGPQFSTGGIMDMEAGEVLAVVRWPLCAP